MGVQQLAIGIAWSVLTNDSEVIELDPYASETIHTLRLHIRAHTESPPPQKKKTQQVVAVA